MREKVKGAKGEAGSIRRIIVPRLEEELREPRASSLSMTRYVFDTSIFIRYRAKLGKTDLLLSVVVFEMVAGAADDDEQKLWRDLASLALRQDRLLLPDPNDWYEAGRILNRLLRDRKPKARITKEEMALLFRDVLIARLVKRAKAVLVTENVRDFDQIRRFCSIQVISGAQFFISQKQK
jgi:predicted nucleic acid-binding protein